MKKIPIPLLMYLCSGPAILAVSFVYEKLEHYFDTGEPIKINTDKDWVGVACIIVTLFFGFYIWKGIHV